MKPYQKRLNIILIWILAIFLMIAIPISSQLYNTPGLAVFSIIFGAFLALALILEAKQYRTLKGLFLILFGVSFQTIYLNLMIFKILPEHTIPSEYKIQLDIFSQVLLFACSGAGGSIIASHADRTSLDNESIATTSKETDTIKELKYLAKSIENLNKKVAKITAILAASAFIALLLLITLLTR